VLRVGIKAKVADLNAKIFCSQEDVNSVKALYNHFWKKGNKDHDANGGPTHAELTLHCVCDMAAMIRTFMEPTENDVIADPGCSYGTQGAILASLLNIRVIGYECDHERVRSCMHWYQDAMRKLGEKERSIRLALFQMNIWQLHNFDHATILVLNDEAFPQVLTRFICNLIWESTKLRWVIMFRPNKHKNDIPIKELAGLKLVAETRPYIKYGSNESSKGFLYRVIIERMPELTAEHNHLIYDCSQDFVKHQLPFMTQSLPSDDEHAWHSGMIHTEMMLDKLAKPMRDPNRREMALATEFSLADQMVSVKCRR
jgi:hypothetical protein